jgi:hypothetical protein
VQLKGEGTVKKVLKRFVLIALVIAGFVAFDAAMDFTARHYIPALFNLVLYPVDVAGVFEYAVGSAVLFLSSMKGVEWLSTGAIAAFAYSAVIIARKLIFRV